MMMLEIEKEGLEKWQVIVIMIVIPANQQIVGTGSSQRACSLR